MMDNTKKIHIIQKKLTRPTRKKVAAYARVSVDFEDNLHSLAAQVSYYNRLILGNRQWEFAGIYSDEGLSGTRTNRPGFQALMDECENGNVDIILTKSISRFARNTVDLLNTVRHLKELGIEVRFERENINSLDSSGELLLTLLASFAQEESRSISENTKWGIRHRFEQGIGNNFILYGYRWTGKEWIVVPDKAQKVKAIFKGYLDGQSPHSLARQYDLSYSTVWDMLRRMNYTGTVILQRTFRENHITHRRRINRGELPRYMVNGYMPEIISKETFDAVQEEIARRKELGYMANTSKKFTCFSSHVFCSNCGKTYRRKTTKKTRESTGTTSIYHKWVCGTKISGGNAACDSCNVPDKVLWNLTADVLGMDVLDEDVFKERIAKITVGEYILHFHFNDGTVISREWEPERNNPVYRRNNGKKSNSDSSNADKVHFPAAG